eukprot:TRINITY_DN980_c0_g1_i1.p1 TRINITY_DN980_c0_g1~~TRINITY_DN980_c0_g1_i1.p1  ORF type:complete len:1717 (+),score=407.18 TRINITY_DN980_c0_g1_i1:338-5152(+)
MTGEKDINSDWQDAATALMVEIAKLAPEETAEALISSIPSSGLPHYFVMKGLADFAHASPAKFIPHLKPVMTKVLPILALVKHDSMRWVFTCALGRFAEAIIQYNAGESNPNANYAVSEFSDSMYTSLNMLHTEWANSKEARLRCAVAESIGNLSAIVAPDVLEQMFVRVLQTLINTLKKEKPKEQLAIIQGLCVFLETSCERINATLQPQLELIWKELHACFCLVQAQPAQLQAELNRNTNELLRCFEVVGRHNVDGLLTLIQKVFDMKFGSKDPTVRASTLSILKHLISRLEGPLEGFKDTLIATLKTALGDFDFRVRKGVVQNIIAMGPSPNRYLACDGGQELIYFVARNAAISPAFVADWTARMAKDKTGADAVTPTEVKEMTTNVLTLFVNSLTILDPVLWPYILECMGHKTSDMAELFDGFPIICQCIHTLANRVSNESYFLIEYDQQVNLPRPQDMVAKTIVHVTQCDPQNKENTRHIAQAMLAIAPLLTATKDQTVPELWQGTVPQLLDYLKSDKFDQVKWEDVNHKLLANTVSAPKNEQWVEQVGDSLISQFISYRDPDRVEYKRVALSMAGLVISKSTKKEYVIKGIELLLENTEHANPKQRLGCAKALGFVSSTHADAVLDRLSRLGRAPGKGGGGGGMFGKKAEPEKNYGEHSKATALLAYGNATMRTPPALITSRMEPNVVPSVVSLLNESKLQEIKEAGLQCVDMIGKGIKKCQGYQLKSKEQIMDGVLVLMNLNPQGKGASPNNRDAFTLVSGGLLSLSAMIQLEPKITPEMTEKLLKAISTLFIKEWAVGEDKKDAASDPASPKIALGHLIETEVPENKDEEELQNSMGMLVCCLLEENTGIERLNELLNSFAEPIRSANPLERQRSLSINLQLLKHYYRVRAPGEAKGTDRELTFLGSLTATLIPRLFDTSNAVRQLAFSGLHTLLELNNEYNPEGAAYTKVRDALEKLLTLRPLFATQDPKELFGLSRQLGNFLAAVISQKDAPVVIESLLQKGLLDVLDDASNAVCVILNNLLHKLGAKLSEEDVTKFIKAMVGSLEKVEKRENTLLGLLHCIKSLSKHHNIIAYNALLSYPIPHENSVQKALRQLAGEPALCSTLVPHLLDVMLSSQLFEQRGKEEQAFCELPLSACCALGEILVDTPEAVQTAQQLQCKLLCTMLLFVSAAHESNKGQKDTKDRISPVTHVLNSFKSYIKHVYGRHANTWVQQQDLWTKLENLEDYTFALGDLLKCVICEDILSEEERQLEEDEDVKPLEAKPHRANKKVKEMYQFILPYTSKAIDCHRITGAALVGQLLFHALADKEIIHGGMNSLLSRSGEDEKVVIKLLAIHGMANISVHPLEEISMFIAPVITTLIACFGDDSAKVILNAMRTLCALLRNVDASNYLDPVIAPICLRVRPAFENTSEEIRVEAFQLFTVLVDLLVAGKLSPTTMEMQIFNNLPSVLVHCNDDEPTVRRPAKQALHAISRWFILNNKKSAYKKLFEKTAYQPEKRMDFDEFSREFTAIWVREYPQYVNDLLIALNGFFKSSWNTIKANAAILTGFMISHIDEEGRKRMNTEQTITGLINLIRTEKQPVVRQKAAKALGLF